jgi:hypothetical protein
VTEWLTWVWNAIPHAWAIVTALGGAIGLILAARARGTQFLIWVLQRLLGHKGGLRLVQAGGKGYWRILKDKDKVETDAARLESRWYATSLVPDMPIRVLTVRMKRPPVVGHLYDEHSSLEDGPPYNTIKVEGPGSTVEFTVTFDLPAKHLREGKDFKCGLTFTDSFNNPHYKTVVFEHRPQKD